MRGGLHRNLAARMSRPILTRGESTVLSLAYGRDPAILFIEFTTQSRCFFLLKDADTNGLSECGDDFRTAYDGGTVCFGLCDSTPDFR